MIADRKLARPSDSFPGEDQSASKTAELTAEAEAKSQSERLKSLLSDIRCDAAVDPLHYLLRSNTSHDGE